MQGPNPLGPIEILVLRNQSRYSVCLGTKKEGEVCSSYYVQLFFAKRRLASMRLIWASTRRIKPVVYIFETVFCESSCTRSLHIPTVKPMERCELFLFLLLDSLNHVFINEVLADERIVVVYYPNPSCFIIPT